ncbi:ribosome maturation factor RimM [Larsenimonas salina]|uniref:ribosome maturation factor RimM n=1 Tax=Larsenimonas salina TaxID=1295565 RepID=UPI0020745583|nr:ribosome maturation factor RimM [Larsenimonas salina]MCM5705577.1 ribosome maturation factor RimM [Larsenimonas salina]
MSALKTSVQGDKSASERVQLGTLTSPHGVKGGLKVYSYTSPIENIFQYPDWLVGTGESLTPMRVRQGRPQGKGLVVFLDGVDSRTDAEALAGATIWLPTQKLEPLGTDEFYWYQIEGLSVVTVSGDVLGRIEYLFETGANDVLVVKGDADSLDKRERLLPYIDGVVQRIDLEQGVMTVDWDPEF